MACLCCAARRTKPTPPGLLSANRLAAHDPFAHVPRLGELVQGAASADRLKLHGCKDASEGDEGPIDPETEVPKVTESKEEQEKRVVEDVVAVAQKLACMAKKYPKSGIGLLSRAQDRFVAVIPGKSGNEVQRWKDGCLGWWDTEESYIEAKSEPKDFILLFKIQKVSASKEDQLAVVVKHRVEKDSLELVLRFKTRFDADAWSYNLWALISKLRGVKD
mmetsp:Transcript_57639/g.134910  ORF Transcript_57639/g.134910 Transcript_57639/m.134910 type:complete len:219 (-) Transcript_57639:76-732(-)